MDRGRRLTDILQDKIERMVVDGVLENTDYYQGSYRSCSYNGLSSFLTASL